MGVKKLSFFAKNGNFVAWTSETVEFSSGERLLLFSFVVFLLPWKFLQWNKWGVGEVNVLNKIEIDRETDSQIDRYLVIGRLIPARRLAHSECRNVKRETWSWETRGTSSRAPGPLGIFTALFTCGPHIENADLPEVGTRL